MSVALALAMMAAVPDGGYGAGGLSSGQLFKLCTATAPASQASCALILGGAFEGLLSAEMEMSDDPYFCLPDQGLTLGDVRATFLGFMSTEIGEQNESAGRSLLRSLEDRYPCPDDDGPDDASTDMV